MYYNCENVISQGGCIVCPICHSKINWNYKRNLLYSSASSVGYPFSEEFHNYVDCVVNTDKKVRFIVHCNTCHVKIETEYMELINNENYEKYKENK